MAVSYNDFISAVKNYYNAQAGINEGMWGSGATWTDISTSMGRVGITTDTYVDYLENFPELFEITRNENGTIIDTSMKKYSYYGNVSSPNYGNVINSNTISSTVGEQTGINIPAVTTVEATTGKLSVKGGIGLKAGTTTATGVVSTIGWSVAAVAAGVQIGKVIGTALYDSNPNIWDEGAIKGLLGTDWGDVAVRVADEVTGGVKDKVLALWGIDGDDTTMYIDEKVLAGTVWYLNENGFFSPKEISYKNPDDTSLLNIKTPNYYPNHIKTGTNKIVAYNVETGAVSREINYNFSGAISIGEYATSSIFPPNTTCDVIFVSTGADTIYENNHAYTLKPITYHGITYYAVSPGYYENSLETYVINSGNETSLKFNSEAALWDYAYLIYNGQKIESGGLDGVTDNPDSKQFDPTGVGSVTSALGALKNQYPELWDNAVTRNTIQDDGSEDTRVFVPVPIPNFNTSSDPHPTSGESTQKDPKVNPDTAPDGVTNTNTKDPTKTDNPNTGGGGTPAITPTTQRASALWAIYNPSLAELNQLGAWLWSDNFLDQIKKIFNDPMQAIIGLHKIYAPPSISGAQNIKVGYLDTGVNSNVVGNQYTYIDCGSVSLREYYGNVLDYSPYTEVRLYLPFIGIVPLDVSDVTRSTISVRYGVDVLTGACIANVSVQRDNAGGVLYTYTGNCAAQYPLSSGSYLGMLSGAVSAIGSLATGNIIGAVGGAMSMRTRVEHSGNFTGNAGAMGIKIPYLIVSRPQSAMNDGFPAIQGYPSNSFVQLKKCTGYVQIKDCHVENIAATDTELDEIKSLLMQGVII